MNTKKERSINIQTTVNAPVEKTWNFFTDPQHIMNWYYASDDWHALFAENDLTVGGRFVTRMAARDGSFSFDFGGEYTKIEKHKLIEFTLDDGRKVSISFHQNGDTTRVEECFEAEAENSVEMQKAGWQAILDNFKKYTSLNAKDAKKDVSN